MVTVEAKADERFGRYVADELRRVAQVPRSNLPCRIRALAELLFGAAVDVGHLRYQLVHGLAATVLEAQRRVADQAVFAVHEFRTPATDDARRAKNHEDLRSFVSTFGVESITPGRLRRISVAGAPSLPVFVGLPATR